MTQTTKLPSLFLSHGAPDLSLSDHPTADFFRQYGKSLPLPKGMVVASAHWLTEDFSITSGPELETIHDFYGFPADLYKIKYPAKTSEILVRQIEQAFSTSQRKLTVDPDRGLDHGAWVPLSLMFPNADIPVVQLSIDYHKTPEQLFEVGALLRSLTDNGILIIGSGGSVHNLNALSPEGTQPAKWAVEFENWLTETLDAKDWKALQRFQDRSDALLAHPTPEHLLPIFLAAGAASPSGQTTKIHESFSYGSLGMGCWAFD